MPQPNLIVILTDDQGYGDLSCMGATDLATPHLDAMAAQGVRFTDWYSNSPVCSPSRASLLTGRYPGNAGVRSILAGHRTATGLPPHVPTLATALKPLGYRTAMAGKWHLGVSEECRPNRHGFDRWFGFLAGCIDYYSHIFYWGMNFPGPGVNPTHDLWEDGTETWLNGCYFTECVTERAVEHIRSAAAAREPFFLYVAYNAPHYPMHAPQQYMDRFAHLPWDRRVTAAMIAAVDDGVGAIMAELRHLGIADNTCTFFTSDNGPSRESRNWLDGTLDPYYGGTTGGLRGHKFSLFEGGIRVPAIMHWPSAVSAGRVISDACASMDVFPTLLRAAGGDPMGYDLDGTDLQAVLQDGAALPQRDLFWEMNGQTAMRRGPWKLVLNGQAEEGAPPADAIHLSNLADDMSESCNLASLRPEQAAGMTEATMAWRGAIEARWETEFRPRAHGTASHSAPGHLGP
jgi:arylsulfatase A-like enzyme